MSAEMETPTVMGAPAPAIGAGEDGAYVQAGADAPDGQAKAPAAIATLEELTRRVVDARRAFAARDRYIAALRAAWEDANTSALAVHRDAKTELVSAETDLREAIVGWWETSDKTVKKPLPGLGVRVGTTVEYDREMALAWAKRSGLCLALDAKAFEVLAETHAIPDIEALCRFGEKVTPTIAADLQAPPEPPTLDVTTFGVILGLPHEDVAALPEVAR